MIPWLHELYKSIQLILFSTKFSWPVAFDNILSLPQFKMLNTRIYFINMVLGQISNLAWRMNNQFICEWIHLFIYFSWNYMKIKIKTEINYTHYKTINITEQKNIFLFFFNLILNFKYFVKIYCENLLILYDWSYQLMNWGLIRKSG